MGLGTALMLCRHAMKALELERKRKSENQKKEFSLKEFLKSKKGGIQ